MDELSPDPVSPATPETAGALLRAARGLPVPGPQEALDRVEHGAGAVMPVSAADLPHLQGKDLGAALRRAQEFWVMNGLAGEKSDVLRAAEGDVPDGPSF